MTPETTPDELVFRIGLVGPSRVGKTSLITALLRDSQRLLQGTPVSMRPLGTPTEKRIAQHRRELDGSLLAGEFTPGALRGTEEPFTFQLLLDSGVRGAGIRLELLDYPGEWLLDLPLLRMGFSQWSDAVLRRLEGRAEAAEFLAVHEYKNVQRWAETIYQRPAVQRGRMVNRINGDKSIQLHERHDASDFDTKTQDKLAAD